MALHDYRRFTDIHGGGFVAVEITTDEKINLSVMSEDSVMGSAVFDKSTAGVILDNLAGAIKILEHLA